MTVRMGISDERVEKVLSTLQDMQAWPHWDEIALGAQKEYGLTLEQFRERLPEYQRFLALCAVYEGIGMISELVDQLWHSHILNTLRYDEFCATVIGHKIHHLPCSSYVLYGVDLENAEDDCTTCKLPSIPSTCYGKLLPGEASEDMEATRQSILGGARRFFEAYRAVFGEPDPVIWVRSLRARLVEAVAV